MTAPQTAVLVIVGTDHHPFARLVDWADDWTRLHPEQPALVQYGYSQPPIMAMGVDFFSPAQLGEAAGRSTVAVTHGGPGTIMDVRRQGRRPIVLPRDPSLGEHVDDHQLRFARWIENKGLILRTTDVTDLDQLVEQELANPLSVADTTDGPHASVRRLQQLLAEMPTSRRWSLRRVRPSNQRNTI